MVKLAMANDHQPVFNGNESNYFEPYAQEWSAIAERVRRNLLIVTSIALFLLWIDYQTDGIKISSLLVINLSEPLSLKIISWPLLLMILYHLTHFLIFAFEEEHYWRVRRTSIKNRSLTNADAERGFRVSDDNPLQCNEVVYDQKQSNLYLWWSQGSKKLLKEWQSYRKILKDQVNKSKDAVAIEHFKKMTEVIERYTEGINDDRDRIRRSLKRFDACYSRLLTIQTMRWYGWECALPLLMGFTAVSYEVCKWPLSGMALNPPNTSGKDDILCDPCQPKFVFRYHNESPILFLGMNWLSRLANSEARAPVSNPKGLALIASSYPLR